MLQIPFCGAKACSRWTARQQQSPECASAWTTMRTPFYPQPSGGRGCLVWRTTYSLSKRD
eukprot:8718968-Prorocentrum_lima.AAC.1